MDLDQDEVLAAQRIGTRLGNWTLERLLGIGGMGSVFYARRTDGAVAALKILHPYLPIDELRKRFVREGPIGSTLAAVGPICEGLPQVFESGIAEDGSAYMAMELLDGESYFDRLVRLGGVLPADDVLWLAHEGPRRPRGGARVQRRAPRHQAQNLFLTRDSRLKVLDFGIARVLEEMPHGSLPEKTMTRTGTRIGSAEYMPPEQARGQIREIDGRSDLFSLGATMYRLLSGRSLHGNLVDAPCSSRRRRRPWRRSPRWRPSCRR